MGVHRHRAHWVAVCEDMEGRAAHWGAPTSDEAKVNPEVERTRIRRRGRRAGWSASTAVVLAVGDSGQKQNKPEIRGSWVYGKLSKERDALTI